MAPPLPPRHAREVPRSEGRQSHRHHVISCYRGAGQRLIQPKDHDARVRQAEATLRAIPPPSPVSYIHHAYILEPLSAEVPFKTRVSVQNLLITNIFIAEK